MESKYAKKKKKKKMVELIDSQKDVIRETENILSISLILKVQFHHRIGNQHQVIGLLSLSAIFQFS